MGILKTFCITLFPSTFHKVFLTCQHFPSFKKNLNPGFHSDYITIYNGLEFFFMDDAYWVNLHNFPNFFLTFLVLLVLWYTTHLHWVGKVGIEGQVGKVGKGGKEGNWQTFCDLQTLLHTFFKFPGEYKYLS